MTLSAMRGYCRGLVLAATGIIWAAGPARAQDVDEPMPEPQHSQLPRGAVVQPLDDGPGGELRRNLVTLAENPRSLEALIGAGRAAIGLRDGETAAGFFTRAGEIAPDDPRVKAGMASAMLYDGRPEQALILFAEAVQRGASAAEIAGDRGLAYDMVGDPRRAQQDYALALRRQADPEIERRLALSLAISGQRAAALHVIDAQLRRHDRAAWRTEAFVLALTGDPAGADDTARRLMPAPNAAAMAPFFARLAYLSPAQKAAAVNFGRFPSDGRAASVASNVDTRADPGALALAQGGQPIRSEPGYDGVRRRPGTTEPSAYGRRTDGTLAPPVQPSRRVELAQAPTRRFAPAQPDPDAEDNGDEREQEQAPPPRQDRAGAPREAPAFAPGARLTLDTSHEEARPEPPPPTAPAAPGFGSLGPTQSPSVRQFQNFTIQPSAPAAGARQGMSDLSSVVRGLPQEIQPGPNAAAAQPLSPAERQARDAAAREMEARYRSQSAPGAGRGAGGARSAGGGRHWVQIAHTGQRAALADQYRQVHARAPGLIESRSAWTLADRGTNRLLIGPFDDERAAQDYIDQLDARHVAAIAWQSGAGQSPERLEGGAGASSSRARAERPEAPPPARAGRGRQAEQRAASDDRRTSRTRAGRAAADEDRSSNGRSGRATSDERSGSAHGRSSRAGQDARDGAHGRSGRDRAAADERSSGHGRSARDRASADERSGSHSRSARDRAGADEGRSAHGRSNARRGGDEDARSSSQSRSGHGRGSSGDDARGSRSRSGQERRQAEHDTRSTRGRSSPEPRPAAPGRRSHH